MRQAILIIALAGWVGQTTITMAGELSTAAAAKKGSTAGVPEKEKAVKKAKVATLIAKGSMPETSGELGLFSELEQSLPDFIKRLDRAAADKEISAVLLQIRNPSIGRGKLEELRAALRRVRAAGKKVFAEIQGATTMDYLVACACDEIVMPESGMLMMPGVRAEVTHYKGLLDKVGVHADMMQMGDFKGAAEPFTRTEMSPEFRKQFETVVSALYDDLVRTVAVDRRLDADKVRELVDLGLFVPEDARKAGLIDRLVYGDQLAVDFKRILSVDEIELVKDYGKKKVEDDFSGILGMAKLFELMLGAKPTKGSSTTKKIAVVYASGMIMPGESASGLMGELMGSDTIIKALRDAEDDKTVVALVLRVDSPGGSSLASDLIWRTVRKCNKPIVASMGDMAASGGYYISMGCDKIYADSGTLTGSIGVVGGKLAIGGLFERIGIHTDVISRGRNSGLLSSESPFTDSERTVWKKMMAEIYHQFVSKAAEGRKMDATRLEQLAGGRIWTGRQAKENGLVDELGTLRDAVDAAKKMAGLAPGEKTELLILPQPRSIFDQLFGADVALESRVLEKLTGMRPELRRALRQAELLGRIAIEPVLTVLPYQVNLR